MRLDRRPPPNPPRKGEGSRPSVADVPWTPQLVRVMAGLMLSMFVAAMDSTVVGTALPTIARELNGFSLYSWVFTGYLLTSTTTVPIWGRLADLYGRKPVLLSGLALFVLASLLCGASTSMVGLILFRTLQGVGAGCLQPVTITVVGDIFPVAQRARLQGLFSAMWAISAVVGPLLGAAFVSTIGWRWIFGINLPIGLAAVLLLLGYREQGREHARGGIDLPGAALLTASIVLLLWGLGAGNQAAQPVIPAVVAAAVLLLAFILWERRSASPTVPLELLRRPSVGPPLLVSLLAGTIMFGTTAYVPLFVQGALGGSTYEAGAVVAPMSLGWPLASVITGRILLRVGYRKLVLTGALALLLGAFMLTLRPQNSQVWWLALSSGVLGVGLGTVSMPILILVQSSVSWQQRGSATALLQFSRTIGGAIGVAAMGVLLMSRIRTEGARLGVPASATANPLDAAGGAVGRTLLSGGVEAVFWVIVGVAVATLAIAVLIFLRRREPDSELG
jgi:EmrB/QacA subfamily drug resistance transporter